MSAARARQMKVLRPLACSIDGCEKKVSARGWCHTHYTRWYRHGDPTTSLASLGGRTCTVDGCDRAHDAQGLCSTHYSRWRLHGTAEDPRPAIEDLFWAKVDRSGDCWLWTATLNNRGYGDFGRRGLAHRFAYESCVGPIPEGLEIDHLCRVRACVRPDHLEAVTHAENVRRAAQAGRARA